MSEKHENPPAFPHDHFDDGRFAAPFSEGMTLRDWYAGQAFAAAFTNATGFGDLTREDKDAQFALLATEVYFAADAMLAARATHQ